MDMPEALESNSNTDSNSHTVIYADDNTPTTSHENIDILCEKKLQVLQNYVLRL